MKEEMELMVKKTCSGEASERLADSNDDLKSWTPQPICAKSRFKRYGLSNNCTRNMCSSKPLLIRNSYDFFHCNTAFECNVYRHDLVVIIPSCFIGLIPPLYFPELAPRERGCMSGQLVEHSPVLMGLFEDTYDIEFT